MLASVAVYGFLLSQLVDGPRALRVLTEELLALSSRDNLCVSIWIFLFPVKLSLRLNRSSLSVDGLSIIY